MRYYFTGGEFSGRYSEILRKVLGSLSAKEVLYESFEDNYQGDVDVDVLLEDGRVFSYRYSYGSCSGCDTWEADGLSDDKIAESMTREATFFDNEERYKAWAKKTRKQRRE